VGLIFLSANRKENTDEFYFTQELRSQKWRVYRMSVKQEMNRTNAEHIGERIGNEMINSK
jgi:hypothetical protein